MTKSYAGFLTCYFYAGFLTCYFFAAVLFYGVTSQVFVSKWTALHAALFWPSSLLSFATSIPELRHVPTPLKLDRPA